MARQRVGAWEEIEEAELSYGEEIGEAAGGVLATGSW
jgi:hypothetical protein